MCLWMGFIATCVLYKYIYIYVCGRVCAADTRLMSCPSCRCKRVIGALCEKVFEAFDDAISSDTAMHGLLKIFPAES